MKHLLLALLIISLPGIAASQKKNVDFAQKLIGSEKVSEARSYLKEAMTTHPTDSDARTWYVAGLVEWRSYLNDVRKLEINPNAAGVSTSGMADKMMLGLDYFNKALHLDSLPDKKGRVKKKYTNDIHEEFNAYAYQLYWAGAVKYKEKKYFPEAYTAFTTAVDIASQPQMIIAQRTLPDSLKAESLYFAALSAFQVGNPVLTLDAINRLLAIGHISSKALILKMSVLEQLYQQHPDSTDLRDSILAVSCEGYSRFLLDPQIFLLRMVEILNQTGRSQEALDILTAQINATPGSAFLHGLRAETNELLGRDQDAIYDYIKASETGQADAFILLQGAHKLYRMGAEAKKELYGTKKQQTAKRKAIINDFLQPALDMAVRARELTSNPTELKLIDNLLENIDYDLSVLK